MERLSRSYMVLMGGTLDEAFGQLFSVIPDRAFMPYHPARGFLPRSLRVVLNPKPNRELNIGGH